MRLLLTSGKSLKYIYRRLPLKNTMRFSNERGHNRCEILLFLKVSLYYILHLFKGLFSPSLWWQSVTPATAFKKHIWRKRFPLISLASLFLEAFSLMNSPAPFSSPFAIPVKDPMVPWKHMPLRNNYVDWCVIFSGKFSCTCHWYSNTEEKYSMCSISTLLPKHK